jgi:two-component system sensor histidine kinase ChvG
MRLDRLISDISAASRIESEMARSEKSRVNLTSIFETLIDIYTTTRENQTPNFHLDVKVRKNKTQIYEVMGLEGQLGQVARNLLDNALSFSNINGHIWIKIAREEEMVRVTIEDEGIGIPPEKLGDIFNRFYSERPKNEAFGQHSGLGLSICQQVITSHDGEIYASNRYSNEEPDKIMGARFTFKLPLLDRG